MKAQYVQGNILDVKNINSYINNCVSSMTKRSICSELETFENKSLLQNNYSSAKNPRKLSNYEIHNSSYQTPTPEDRRSSVKPDYINTEPQKDLELSAYLKKATRRNTRDLNQPRQYDDPLTSSSIERPKGSISQERRPSAQRNFRVSSHKKVVTKLPIRDYYRMKTTDESLIGSRKQSFNKYVYEKRSSAQGEKINNYVETSLPAIYINGVDRFDKSKILRIKAPNMSCERSEASCNNSYNNIAKVQKKETVINKSNNKPTTTKMPLVRDENSKRLRIRIKHESSLSPGNGQRIVPTDRSFTSNLQSTNSLSGKSIALSSNNDKEKSGYGTSAFHMIKKEVSLLEAVQKSLDPTSRGSHFVSLDSAFEKVNELTNKNNIARYDLLKIQESALDLKMKLHLRKSQFQKSGKDTSRTNQTALFDGLSISNSSIMHDN